MADTASKPRRRSWFQKNGGFTSFFMTGGSSRGGNSPPTMTQEAQQPTSPPSPPSRSRSLDMAIDNEPAKSTLASRISKAAKRGLKRIPTSVDLRRLDDTSDSSSSNKRSKVIPINAPSTPPSEEDKVLDATNDTFIASDEAEADRIQFKSDLIRLAFEGEFSIPFDLQELRGGKLLDIGCGPGSYCLEMAQRYPNVDVYGIDIADHFPLSPLPTNCTFLVINALDDQFLFDHFDQESIDFIHIRFMSLSFTKKQYMRVVSNCWKLLKPGGYLELMEMDFMIYSPGPTTEQMNHDMLAAARYRGLKPRMARHLWSLFPKDAIRSVENYRSLPLGVWGGRLGVMSRDDIFNIMEHCQGSVDDYKAANHLPNRMTAHGFELQSQIMAKEFDKHHSYINFYFTVGQKPSESSS